MAAGDGVFNIAKGRWGEMCRLPGGGRVYAYLFKGTMPSDDTMADYTTIAAVKAAITVCDFTNYARLLVAGLTPVINNTANSSDFDCVDLQWNSAGGPVSGNNTVTKVVFAFEYVAGDPETSIVPMTFHAVNSTTTGTNLVLQIPTSGFVGAT